MKCGIYGIKNITNGKWYIGQSVNISLRRAQHFSDLRHNRSRNEHLQCAFNKYGEASFEFHILEEVPENILDVREKAWIKYYKSNQREFGYNQDGGGNIQKHISELTRNKLSIIGKNDLRRIERCRKNAKTLKGKPISEEHRRRISEGERGEKNWAFGKHFSKEHCKKLSEAHKGEKNHNFGKHFSEEHCRKISESEKGKIVSAETRQKLSKALKGKKTPKLRKTSFRRNTKKNIGSTQRHAAISQSS